VVTHETKAVSRVSTRDFARAYRTRWPIIPVGPDKRQVLPSWKPYMRRLSTPVEVDQWWPSDDPDRYGLAVVCGEVSGVIVLDADGSQANAELRARTREDGSWLSRSGGGGLHAWYRFGGETRKIKAVKFADGSGIDVLGEGGYCIIPPSFGRYRWIRQEGNTLPSVPDWAKVEPVLTPRATGAAGDRPGLKTIFGGERHAAFCVIAGAMAARGEDVRVILSEIERVNASACIPPMEPAELATELAGIARSLPGWSA
jgi:hypothetical protein